MICPDCLQDASKTVTMVFEAKQMGEVCPRCERVFSIFLPKGGHKHYATEKGYRAAILRDQKLRRHNSGSTKAMVERILRPID